MQLPEKPNPREAAGLAGGLCLGRSHQVPDNGTNTSHGIVLESVLPKNQISHNRRDLLFQRLITGVLKSIDSFFSVSR